MPRFAIRANSVADLFDPYSPEPIERRPLEDIARQRILRTWIDTKHERPERLTVELPAAEHSEYLDARVREAIRHDLVETYQASRRWRTSTRGERRETRVAFAFMVVCLFASSIIDNIEESAALLNSLSQGLVVLGWVALWQPADRMFRAVARRLNRSRYRELAEVPIEIAWV